MLMYYKSINYTTFVHFHFDFAITEQGILIKK